MISFRPYGRLGNFMFMMSNAVAQSLKNDEEFSVPYETTNGFWNPIYFPSLIHPSYTQGREDILVNESGHHYTPLEFSPDWKGKYVIYNGYFQSEKYFKEYRSELLYIFDLPYKLVEKCSIHARFGDYLKIEGKHILIDEPYLMKAMALIKERTGLSVFKVFSDDIKYFKDNFGHIYDFEYSTNTDEMTDMIEISNCHSNINSSSTFSWWGAWLNQNPDKVVITQTEWFQKGWCGLITDDIIPSEWIKL